MLCMHALMWWIFLIEHLNSSVLCCQARSYEWTDEMFIVWKFGTTRMQGTFHVPKFQNGNVEFVYLCGSYKILPSSQNDCPTSWVFFVSKQLYGLFAQLEILGSKSKFLCQFFIIKKSFDTATLGGIAKYLLFFILIVIPTTIWLKVRGH